MMCLESMIPSSPVLNTQREATFSIGTGKSHVWRRKEIPRELRALPVIAPVATRIIHLAGSRAHILTCLM